MTTTTSFSKKGQFIGLYKSTFSRNIGYLAVIFLLMLIFYPAQYMITILSIRNQIAYYDTIQEVFSYNLVGSGLQYTTISMLCLYSLMIIVPIFLALLLNSYMQRKKATDVYHSLPVRRETLLLSNVAVGFSLVAVPYIICTIIVVILQVSIIGADTLLLGNIFGDMFCWLVASLLVLVITTLVCVLSSNLINAFLFSGVLMGAPIAILYLYKSLMSSFLYGYSRVAGGSVIFASPLTQILFRLRQHPVWNSTDLLFYMKPDVAQDCNAGMLLFIALLVLAIAVLALAVKLYQKRKSELAQTNSSKGVFITLIKLLGTVVCSAALGFLFSEFDSNHIAYIIWAVIGGGVAFCLIEIIISRGIKSLRHSIPAGIASLAVSLAFPIIIMTGGFGYVERIPQISDIESIEISYESLHGNMYHEQPAKITRPTSIEAVLNYHQQLISEKPEWDTAGAVYNYVEITYVFGNGQKMKRTYHTSTSETTRHLFPLETDEDIIKTWEPIFLASQSAPEMTVSHFMLMDSILSKQLPINLTAKDQSGLIDAMKADILAVTQEDLVSRKPRILGFITYQATPVEEQFAYTSYSLYEPAMYASDAYSSFGYFTVTDKSINTLAFLESKGLSEVLVPDLGKMTQAKIYLNTDASGYYFPQGIICQQLPPEKYKTYTDIGFMDEENVVITLDDPADLYQILKNVPAYFMPNEPLALVEFYEANSQDYSNLYIPISKLPKELQQEMIASQEKSTTNPNELLSEDGSPFKSELADT